MEKKFFQMVTKVYVIKRLVKRVISCCTECRDRIFACVYEEEPDKKKSDENDSKQMDFVDDNYIENFEMLQYSTKNLEERTKSLELKLDFIINNNKNNLPEDRINKPRVEGRTKTVVDKLDLVLINNIQTENIMKDRTKTLEDKLEVRTKKLEEKLEDRSKTLEDKLNTILEHLKSNK